MHLWNAQIPATNTQFDAIILCTCRVSTYYSLVPRLCMRVFGHLCIPCVHEIACVRQEVAAGRDRRIGVNTIYLSLFMPILSLSLSLPPLFERFFLSLLSLFLASPKGYSSIYIYIYMYISLYHFAFNPLFIATVCRWKRR